MAAAMPAAGRVGAGWSPFFMVLIFLLFVGGTG
jgi:hypothetical protein